MDVKIDDSENKTKPTFVAFTDLVFVLLIFFIVVTIASGLKFISSTSEGYFQSQGKKEPGEKANLPRADAGTDKEDVGLTIRIEELAEKKFVGYLFDQYIPNKMKLDDSIRVVKQRFSTNINLPPTEEKDLKNQYGPFSLDNTQIGASLPASFISTIKRRAELIKKKYSSRLTPFQIHIRADENTYYGYIIDIFIICRDSLNIHNINFEVITELE